jgi:glucuronate isomerase
MADTGSVPSPRCGRKGDHYEWRGMRANGVAKRFCTGDASDGEKFEA